MSTGPQAENAASSPTPSPTSTPTKKPGLSPASWIALVLLVGALGIGGYIYSFWYEFNSKTGALKAKGGDFRQLRLEEPDPDTDERSYLQKFLDSVTPNPIQVVYWKNKSFTEEDATLITRFQDAEIVVISTDNIKDSSIQHLLTLPKLIRIRIVGMESIGTEQIDKWSPPESIKSVTLANPKWSRADIREVSKRGKENEALKECLEVSSEIGPSAAGG